MAALLALHDVAFQWTKGATLQSAVDCVITIGTGRLPASATMEDKSLKLAINALFAKSECLIDALVESSMGELEHAEDYAVKNYGQIQKANREFTKEDQAKWGHFAPASNKKSSTR